MFETHGLCYTITLGLHCMICSDGGSTELPLSPPPHARVVTLGSGQASGVEQSHVVTVGCTGKGGEGLAATAAALPAGCTLPLLSSSSFLYLVYVVPG